MSVTSEIWKALVQKGVPSLFRLERSANRLMQGFTPSLKTNPSDIPGIYFARNKEDIMPLIEPFSSFGNSERSVQRLHEYARSNPNYALAEAKLLPDAKFKSYSVDEWKDLLKETGSKANIPSLAMDRYINKWGYTPDYLRNKIGKIPSLLDKAVEDYNAVEFPDIFFRNKMQTVIRKPNSALLNIRNKIVPLSIVAGVGMSRTGEDD